MNRLIYLDNLRSFALLLGLVFHAAIVYSTGIGYTVKSNETSKVYSWFVLFVHTFRMPLFFFLSGYFAELVITRKSISQFLNSRIYRILLPGIVGLILFSPVDGYFRNTESLLIKPTYLMHLVFFFQGEHFTLSHIWFLYYLFIFSIIYLAVRNLVIKINNIKNIYLLRFLITSLSFLFIFIPNLFFNKENFFLEIRPMFFFYYLFFFFTGAYIYKNNHLELFIPNHRKLIYLIPFLGMLFGLYVLIEEVDQYWMNFLFDPLRIKWRIIHLILEVTLAWGLSLSFLSIFRLIGNKESYYSKEITKSLLPVYLIHHPVSIFLGYAFSISSLRRDASFLLHLFLVFIISFYFYYIIKKFKFTSFLFGIQKDNKERIPLQTPEKILG